MTKFNITDVFYLAGPLGCAIMSFFVSRQYKGSEIFGRSYLLLGIAFSLWFIGDVTYYYLDRIVQEDPYPSPADFFFIGFYTFSLMHLVINTRYFKRSFGLKEKLWVPAIPITITIFYIWVSMMDYGEIDFDFFYGLLFVIGASIVLSFAILGATAFKSSLLGHVWLLLASGMSLITFADVWYYHTELLGQFSTTHPLNSVWLLSFMIIIYALYKHQEKI